MNFVQPISTLPKDDAPRLLSTAHAAGDGEDRGSVVPSGPRATPASEARQGPQPEPNQFDRAFHAMLAGLDRRPVADCPFACLYRLGLAFSWGAATANGNCPGRLAKCEQLLESAPHCFAPDQAPWSLIKPQPQDRRFTETEWERPPFNLLAQAFLLSERWWHDATTGVRGVAPTERGDCRILGTTGA